MYATETIQSELFKDFHPNSKIWIYTAERVLKPSEIESINTLIFAFTKDWTAHNQALKASGTVMNNRFIILAVDETQANASGCSIDKSIHFIKSIETSYSLNLFNRLSLIYMDREVQKLSALSDLPKKIADGEILKSTLIFDTTLTQLGKFRSEFMKEAGQSWVLKFFK